MWRLFSGPLLLLLIPLYLSAEVQGYWYTFISLAALAIFADMGFSTILLQFSAHEFAHLKFENGVRLSGDEHHLRRLASLLRFAMKWSSGMALVTFPILLVIGFIVLSQKQTQVEWFIPWLIYALASVLVFINSMLLSFIEGCNSVGEVQKIRFFISFVSVVATAFLLIAGFHLYALVGALLLGALVGTSLIFRRYGTLLRQLYRESEQILHPWRREILPLLGRYALSWVSGYLIFSLFTPITFYYYGVVESGVVGLSLAICTALFGIANIWMILITPKINMLVSHHEYETLNPLFKKHLLLSLLSYLFFVLLFFVSMIFFAQELPFFARLVTPFALILLFLAWFLQMIVNALALYMRAHKKEPLVWVSLVMGLYSAVTTWLIAIYLPFEYLFAGFLSSYIFTIPWVMVLFKKYKKGSF